MFSSVCENSACAVGNASQYGSLSTGACPPLPVTPSARDNVGEQKKQICDGDQVERGSSLYVEDFGTSLFRDRISWRQVSGHINVWGTPESTGVGAIPGMYVVVIHCAEWQPERVGAVLVPSRIEQRAQDCVFLERARSM